MQIKSAKPLNILVVRTDRIGDVVLTTAAVRALRKNFPDARITMMVAPSTSDLVHGNPDIDDIIIHDRAGRNKGVLGLWRQVFNLRKKKFDWASCLMPASLSSTTGSFKRNPYFLSQYPVRRAIPAKKQNIFVQRLV